MLRLRPILALVSGVATAAAFAPIGWWPLLPLGVAGLSVAVVSTRGFRAFGLGLLYGLGFMGLLLPWLSVIGTDAWLGLSLLEASFYGLLGVGLARVERLPGAVFWAAGLWVAVDALRSAVPWGGFPWGRLAFATVDTPMAPAMAALGTSGTTFCLALLGVSLARLPQREPSIGSRATPVLLAFLVAAAVSVLGTEVTSTGSGQVQVAAVQGDVPGEGMSAFAERRAVLNNHVGATLDLARRIRAGTAAAPDFVLWPESSTDIDPFTDASVYNDIQSAADAVGVPILVGAMVGGPGRSDVRNQGIVWSPELPGQAGGPGQTYSKTHPVPFGEYIPMRSALARFFERLDQIPRDMVPGTEPGLLDLAGTPIGDVICFEIAYDDTIRDLVTGGAQLLVVQTNNATYMGSGQVEQQFAIARLRAIQTRRYIAVVATNGISGFIGPDGSVLDRAPTRTTEVLDAAVPLRTGITPGVRLDAGLELGLSVVGALGFIIGGWQRRRRTTRRPQPSHESTVPVP